VSPPRRHTLQPLRPGSSLSSCRPSPQPIARKARPWQARELQKAYTAEGTL
jgi:hypothetical protein